ncbi:DEAD/DEAH box helicase, partial [Dokdonella sp.]|uniref:primosomal protein N' family DNA-binding protein n=2 Tax=Dokdonella sp. TaxID=2291710 RepID=UPI003BAEA4CF
MPLPRLFDYRLEPGVVAPAIGARVRVPFSGRDRVGVVLSHDPCSDLADDQLKPLLEILDAQPLLTGELVATLEWASRYYQHAIGEVFDAALPAVLRRGGALPPAGIAGIALTPQGREGLAVATPAPGTRIGRLLELLGGGALATADLDQRLPAWRNSARTLKNRGWLQDCRLQAWPIPAPAVAAPLLNDEQRAAVDALGACSGTFATFLLDGVTGSGKTEVYLASIAETIRQGRQALVLVPEIALTPQTTRRFRERLGFDVAILHSGLGEGERAAAWLAAARGEARVV